MEPTRDPTEPPRPSPALAAVALAAAALYALCCTPAYALYDTAELSWAGFTLGVSHPPGQPSYSMLAKLATLLPFGSVAFRVALVSAFGAALAVWITGRLGGVLAGRLGLGAGRSVVEVLSALAMAASAPLVNQATRAEVYAPAVAAFGGTLLLALAAVHAPSTKAAARHLAAGGVVASLAATLHPAAGLGALLVALAIVALSRPSLLGSPRVWLSALAGLVIGIVPIVWVAMRCRLDVPCWEGPLTPATFLKYIRGAQYQSNFQTGAQAWEAIGAALRFTMQSTLWAPAVAILFAFAADVLTRPARPGRAQRLVVLALVVVGTLVPLLFLSVAHFYPDNPDAQGYLLPAIMMLLAGGTAAAASIGERLAALPAALRLAPALVVAALAAAAGRPDAYVRSRYWFPLTLSDHAFDEALPKAFVLTTSDHLFFAMQYGQLVEGARPDVGVMVVGLAGNRHHWWQVAQRRPEIAIGRARRRAERDSHDAWARAALDLADGVVPRFSETALYVPDRARASGVLFDLDGRRTTPAPIPRPILRELRRRRATYADGSDRMLRLWRLERAYEREGHGEIDAAVREVLAGLWEERGLRRRLAGVRLRAPLRYRPITPVVDPAWVADPSTMRSMLAQLLYRGWRTDLAVRVLDRDYHAGNPQAALVLAELLLYDGQLDEAEATYRAFAQVHSDWADYGAVGVALVRGARGDLAGALRQLRHLGRAGSPPSVRGWALLAQAALLPNLGPHGVR